MRVYTTIHLEEADRPPLETPRFGVPVCDQTDMQLRAIPAFKCRPLQLHAIEFDALEAQVFQQARQERLWTF